MEPSRQKAVAAAEARELEKQLAATEKAATEKAAAEKATAEKAAVVKAAAEKAAAEKAAAEQKRKARAERAKYFSALRTEVHAVEAAVGRVQDDEADIDADAEVNSILYPSVPRLDPAADCADCEWDNAHEFTKEDLKFFAKMCKMCKICNPDLVAVPIEKFVKIYLCEDKPPAPGVTHAHFDTVGTLYAQFDIAADGDL